MRRRSFLALAGVPTGLAPVASLWAAARGGDIEPPQPALALTLTDTNRRRTSLAEILRGQTTLVQLMFTGCGTVCPAQGLLFATLAGRPRPQPARWLSISIDTLGDDPARLRAWQARFGLHPSWLAAVPDTADVDRLSEFLRGGPVKPGTHGTQVFVFDAQARLVHRTADNPSVAEIEALIRRHAGGESA
jgi:protein SCO1